MAKRHILNGTHCANKSCNDRLPPPTHPPASFASIQPSPQYIVASRTPDRHLSNPMPRPRSPVGMLPPPIHPTHIRCIPCARRARLSPPHSARYRLRHTVAGKTPRHVHRLLPSRLRCTIQQTLFSAARRKNMQWAVARAMGVQFLTALTACQIIANNAFDGYLTEQADGTLSQRTAIAS